jgi:predicted acylesterase/phospholipase RssA
MSYTNLVIGGAGSKNYASLGAISKLETVIPNIKKFLGVSSGSILATLLAVGCTKEELKKYYDSVDFSRYKIKYNSLYTYYKLYRYGGIHDSSDFREQVIHKILQEKTGDGNITFKQIFEKYDKVLVIPSTCVNKRKMFYYNHISNPDMSVKYAIEQSCCVPGLFYPIVYKENTLVDAGIIDNYPLYYFNKEELPDSRTENIVPLKEDLSENTFGILIVDEKISRTDDPNTPYLGNDDTSSFQGYLKCILNTLLTTNSRCRVGPHYWDKTIAIDIGPNIDGVSDMGLSEEQKTKMFKCGEEEAEKFLSLH